MDNTENSEPNETIFNVTEVDNADKTDEEQSNSEYNTTETSCSINSEDCIEYDSEVSSNDSIFFYSESDDFIENRFLRINHKPFMKILKDKHNKLSKNCPDESNPCDDATNNIPCPSSMSRYINKDLFTKIDKLNDELELEYNNLKQILNITDNADDKCPSEKSNDNKCSVSCDKSCNTSDDPVCEQSNDKSSGDKSCESSGDKSYDKSCNK